MLLVISLSGRHFPDLLGKWVALERLHSTVGIDSTVFEIGWKPDKALESE